MTTVADIKEVYSVNLIAKSILGEVSALIKPSKLGIKNMLKITKKNIDIIRTVILINVNSNFERMILHL
jgi:hypothetical protein